MSWADLKARLQNQTYTITRVAVPKSWSIAMDGQGVDPLTFTALGQGTNKLVCRIDGHPWVMAFGWSGRALERTSFKEEVDTLEALGFRGVNVPAPFLGGVHADFVFSITTYDDGNEVVVPAFLQEYLNFADFDEMPKKVPAERDNWAKVKIVPGNRVPLTIEKTLTDINKIKDVFAVLPWGDFQVMYNKISGAILVFDPLKTDPNALAYKKSIDTWLADIAEAKASTARAQVVFQKLVGMANTPGDRRKSF